MSPLDLSEVLPCRSDRSLQLPVSCYHIILRCQSYHLTLRHFYSDLSQAPWLCLPCIQVKINDSLSAKSRYGFLQ